MQTNKDTVILDISDSNDLQELFSRLEAGDKVRFRGEGSLQDKTEGVVVITIEEVKVSAPAAKQAAEKDNNDEPVSVKAAKGQMDDEEQDSGPAQPMAETAGPLAGPTEPMAPKMREM